MLEIYIIKKMRVYKSPVQLKPQNMHKKSSINFVKNVAAPKLIKNQNIYNNQKTQQNQHNIIHKLSPNSASIQKHRQNNSYTLGIIIKHKSSQPVSNSSQNIKKSIINSNMNKKAIRTFFPYNTQTQIRHFISFVHNQIQDNLVYVKSQSIYVDYILGLKDFKIKKLVELLKEEQGAGQSNKKNKDTLELQVTCCQYEDIQTDNYLKNFQIIKCVGSGGFSKVYLVRAYGKLMAMKVINKEYIISNDKSNIINNQKTILSICSDHPFMTNLHNSFETKHFLIFVMEFCNGGQLFNLLRKVRRMKQDQAQFYFVQTLSAIAHLHRKGIVYRDIKPENIIIDYEGHIRLADYGLSKIMEDSRESKTYSFCGSAEYMAPEMLLKKGHSFEIDFYCLGALLYQLVIGLPPYYSRNQNQLFSNIIHNDLQFPGHVSLSDELKHFLQHLLQKQVQNRYRTLEQILADPWMRNIRMQDVINKKLKPPYKTDMFGYNFDDSDFAQEQKQVTQNLLNEKNYSTLQDIKFHDFFYESKQIAYFKSVIFKSKQQGLFIRSNNHLVGQFIAESYHLRTNSNNGSIIMANKHSRQPSINKIQNSRYVNLSTSNPIARRIQTQIPQRYQQSSQTSQLICYPSQKEHLHTVRSLQHIEASKSAYNRPLEKINVTKKFQGYKNIYTTQKNQFQPFNSKVSNSSSLVRLDHPLLMAPNHPSLIALNHPSLMVSNHPKSFSYVRQPNYYSVQKPNSRGQGIRLDIQNLSIKNQRNHSMQKNKDIYSSPNFNLLHNFTPQSLALPLKHAVSAHELKKNYVQGFRERLLPSKVKKPIAKNGEKISMSMLNNSHYRN